MHSANNQYKSYKIKGSVRDYMQHIRNEIPNNADRRLIREQLIPVINHIERINLNYYPDFSPILKQYGFTSRNIRDFINLNFERLSRNIIFPHERQIIKSNDNEKSIMLIRLILESAEEFLNSIIYFIQNKPTKVKNTEFLLNCIKYHINQMNMSTLYPQQNNNNTFNSNNILNCNNIQNYNIGNYSNNINNSRGNNNDTNINSSNNVDSNNNHSSLNNINMKENKSDSSDINDINDDNNNRYAPITNLDRDVTDNEQSGNNKIIITEEKTFNDSFLDESMFDNPFDYNPDDYGFIDYDKFNDFQDI